MNKTNFTPEMELERLRYELRIIADMASESMPLVNEVCTAITPN